LRQDLAVPPVRGSAGCGLDLSPGPDAAFRLPRRKSLTAGLWPALPNAEGRPQVDGSLVTSRNLVAPRTRADPRGFTWTASQPY